jgi:16S rRNA (guanine527-N7)-methyltransferase
MQPARIAELLQPFLNPCHSESGPRPGEESAVEFGTESAVAVLTPAQLQNISTYIDILQRWNARINLTAIRDEEEIVTRHFGESLFAAQHLLPRGFPRCTPVPSVLRVFDSLNDQRPTTNDRITAADVGSGAGFPGIPIKLWAPAIALTLIESNHKKATFLREIIRSLTLTDINVFPGRAEQLAAATPPAQFDLVTLRAVESFALILPIAASLLAPGGRLALLIGRSQTDEAHSILPTLSWDAPTPIPQSTSRILLIAHSRPVR